MKRAALYLRVSTIDQTTANQERELREIADRMGCEIVKVYKDHGISGAKGRDQQPAFNSMCRAEERVRAGLARARSEAKRLGRPTSHKPRKTPYGRRWPSQGVQLGAPISDSHVAPHEFA